MEKDYIDDHELLTRLQQDNEKAFNEIYDRYWSLVYTDAFRRVKSHAKAQDLTQDLFIKLWTRRKELDISNLRAYLRVGIRNRVFNLFEKERRYVPFEKLLQLPVEENQADITAIRNEFMAAYQALVDALPEKRQKIFRYRFDDGLSTEEIAEKLNISRKTVQNQLGRATSSVRSELTQLIVIAAILQSFLSL
ncbi:MAG TPA: sigma-70 family RNA polymerase sigma factor [Chitinophagaceae bacterium]|nr:sigma-70 family RNA polymerase sigma factor [Chitinophagaceae bacterium]